MLFAVIAWVGMAATYVLFAGQVSGHEAIAGLGASLLAAAYAVVAHRAAEHPFRLRLAWFGLAASVARSLAVDTVKVVPAMLFGRPGALSRQALPQDAGPRAAAILAISVAPNGFVVATEGETAIAHVLAPADAPR